MRTSVIKTFLKRANLSNEFEAIANLVFDDLLLLLTHVHNRQKDEGSNYRFSFTRDLDLMDEMWHAFILHTRYYTEYCLENFGTLIHHLPENEDPKTQSEDDKINLIDLIETQIHDLKSALGKDFVNRIYFVYPRILSLKDVENV